MFLSSLRSSLVRRSALAALFVLSLSSSSAFAELQRFRRGDADANGRVQLNDAIRVLEYLFSGDDISCERAADADDDGAVLLTDAVTLLNFLFQGAESLPGPGGCGLDITEDTLTCASYPSCSQPYDNTTVVDGYVVAEGDIIVGRVEDIKHAGDGGGGGFMANVTLWPGGIVPFSIDSNVPNQNRVQNAINNIQNTTSVVFVPRTSETNFIRIRRTTNDDICGLSPLGMRGGPQDLLLHDDCGTGTVIHELGHALGLQHEHTRCDRDDFITINYLNADMNFWDQFFTGEGQMMGPYDYGSIMHYSAFAFSVNNQPTITTTVAGVNIGQRTALSDLDAATIDYFYSPCNQTDTGWYIGDFNGDGLDDIFRQVNQWGGAEVFLSDGNDEFIPAGRWTGAGARGYGWTVGDFNGDGRDDIFRQLNQWGGAEVFLSTGSGFGGVVRWTGAGHRGYGWTVGDFNGDGRDDIFRQLNQWGGAEVLLSTGSSFGGVVRWTGAGARGYGWTVGDFNGDGRDDIFRQLNQWGGAEVLLSTGSSFGGVRQWTGAGHRGAGFYVGDFDGDGRSDIFRFATPGGGAEMLRSSGWQFVPTAQFAWTFANACTNRPLTTCE